MKKKIYSTLASSSLLLTLALADAQGTPAIHDERDRAHTRQGNASRARRRVSKARRSLARRAVSYACPMHPDMRSRSRGECPKCGMALVAARRVVKSAGEGHTEP
jgi:hypothetical protein